MAFLSVKEQKIKIRSDLLALRYAIADNERAAAEKSMIKKILSLASFRFAESILLYYPIKGEPSLLPLVEAIIKDGKRVAFPLCHTEDCTLTYHYISSLNDLKDGSYGTKEPLYTYPIYIPDKNKNDMILVPGISFDKHGYRLGYGKGYYDRFLTSFEGTQIGVTFHKLFSDKLPRGHYDKKVCTVLTEKGVFSTI